MTDPLTILTRRMVKGGDGGGVCISAYRFIPPLPAPLAYVCQNLCEENSYMTGGGGSVTAGGRAAPYLRRLVAGFPPRRPGLKPGSGYVGFCDGQKWRWGRFSPRELRFPLPIYIISSSPQSSSLSPEAGTIGQEWPKCQ
jgi:hypothetical protein